MRFAEIIGFLNRYAAFRRALLPFYGCSIPLSRMIMIAVSDLR